MTVEVATKISQLNVSLPGSGDSKSEGDDHIRLIKVAVLGTLTGCDTTGVAGFNVVTQATANSSTLAASTALVDAKVALAGFTASQIDVQTNAATSKPTPVDADAIPLVDSATGFTLKKLTWANLKATLFNGTLAGSFTTLSATGAATVGAGLAVTGTLTVVTPAPLGYGTGAGGTVTQATSKSTSVTLNKPTGQITMNTEALAAGASVQFAAFNSLVTGADYVGITTTSGGSQAYEARVYTTSNGSFAMNVKNISAGSLSEAVVINFTIIKGALS